MRTREQLTEAITAAIRESLEGKGLERTTLVLETEIDGSLGLDSLDWASVVVQLEDGLGVDPFQEGVDRELRTIKDLVDVYQAALGRRSGK